MAIGKRKRTSNISDHGTTDNFPIDLTRDSKEEAYHSDLSKYATRSPQASRYEPISPALTSKSTKFVSLIDDDDDDDQLSDEAFTQIFGNSNHERSSPNGIKTSQLSSSRATSNQVQSRQFDSCRLPADKFSIGPGDAVELMDSTFMKVQSTRRTSTGALKVRGYPLMRDFDGASRLVDSRPNELIWMVQIDDEEHKAGLESQLVERNVAEVKRLRDIVFTNCPWDRNAQPVGPSTFSGNTAMLPPPSTSVETLYCRWKYLRVVIKKGTQECEEESCFRLLYADEIEDMVQLKPVEMRRFFRNGESTERGGSHVTESFDIDTGTTTFVRRYTTGDAFCGAGGLSRGALDAGLKVRWGFDCHEPAITTYRANLGPLDTRALPVTDQEFTDLIQEDPGGYWVDHVHFSPPCQPFSAANTTGTAERNWENSRPVFSLCQILKILKPRVATIEETPGLVQRHHDWFYTVIANITRLGYSIRWKRIDATKYGVPQYRKRLLLNIAAPGEKVPPFPEPTHGEHPPLKAPNKISIIRSIPRWATRQDAMTQARQPETLLPHSWNSFAHTLTTNGGQNNHHPDGGRYYTVREMACLQRFPHNYEFFGSLTEMKRMVGNAVPPALAKTWLREVVKSLKETDDEERGSRQRSL